jgi:hypothetical protein
VIQEWQGKHAKPHSTISNKKVKQIGKHHINHQAKSHEYTRQNCHPQSGGLKL